MPDFDIKRIVKWKDHGEGRYIAIVKPSLTKVEKGDPTVSIGIYAKVIFVLGLIDDLYNIADPYNDYLGRRFDE